MKKIVVGFVCLQLAMVSLWSAPSFAFDQERSHRVTDNHIQKLSWADQKYLKRLKRTAVVALTMAVFTVGLHAMSDAMFYTDHEVAARSMGITAMGMSLTLPAVFYLSNRFAFQHFGAEGNRNLRAWAWVLSGAAAAEVLGIAIAGLTADINPRPGLITMAGVLAAMGFSLFALDGISGRKQIKQRMKADANLAVQWMPYLAPANPTRNQRRNAIFGIAGLF
ncbi:MAG: hypothetical protein JXR76_10860 [Deltaproteobacteria bacterium]|nr:hypothetical protein [Deltaproteobacteria bacterium]